MSMKAGQYHLLFWGSIQNDGLATRELGTSARDFWFASADERAAFRAKIERIAEQNGRIVVFAEHEGPNALLRTIARMTFILDGQKLPCVYDFGYGYPADSAEYMFRDGNHSCDCNRSLILARNYPDAGIPEYGCGNEIEMTDFRIEQAP